MDRQEAERFTDMPDQAGSRDSSPTSNLTSGPQAALTSWARRKAGLMRCFTNCSATFSAASSRSAALLELDGVGEAVWAERRAYLPETIQ